MNKFKEINIYTYIHTYAPTYICIYITKYIILINNTISDKNVWSILSPDFCVFLIFIEARYCHCKGDITQA